MMIDFDGRDLLIGIGILCILLPIIGWKKRSLSYLIFFSLFWVYLLAVVSVIIFPIVVNPESTDIVFAPSINFIPFYLGNCFLLANLCLKSIVENIAITIPLGFGINFLVKIKPKNILWLALGVGFVFELSQLIISLIFRSGFRAIDINDVILNSTGVLIGYGLFRLFAWLYLKISKFFDLKHKAIFADIYNIAIQAQADGILKNID